MSGSGAGVGGFAGRGIGGSFNGGSASLGEIGSARSSIGARGSAAGGLGMARRGGEFEGARNAARFGELHHQRRGAESNWPYPFYNDANCYRQERYRTAIGWQWHWVYVCG
jgi:hypothetical protein